MNDTRLLDWLEQAASDGSCPALICDDNGHWAVAFDGMQNVPEGDDAQDIVTSFFIEKDGWFEDVRTALRAAYKDYEERG